MQFTDFLPDSWMSLEERVACCVLILELLSIAWGCWVQASIEDSFSLILVFQFGFAFDSKLCDTFLAIPGLPIRVTLLQNISLTIITTVVVVFSIFVTKISENFSLFFSSYP